MRDDRFHLIYTGVKVYESLMSLSLSLGARAIVCERESSRARSQTCDNALLPIQI